MALSRNFVCLRNLPNELNLKLSLLVKGNWLELNRVKKENVNKTLQRISLKINPSSKKKKKKKSDIDVSRPIGTEVKLLDSTGTECTVDSLSNEDALVAGNILLLHTGEDELRYQILANPPSIIDCHISDKIMVGFPIFPEINLEFATLQHSKFTWWKALPSSEDWGEIGREMIYTPQTSDIGHRLKLTCQPGSKDQISPITKDHFSKDVVSAGPGMCLFDQRHMYTRKAHALESNEIRAVCYNILADVFATSEFARNTLYPFAPEYVLSLNYRKLLIAKELNGYNADFISLQECGKKLFEGYLNPFLELNGFGGFYFGKLGEMPEGEALFYRKERYEHVEDLSISVRDALYLDCNVEILSALTETPSVLESLHKKTAVGQIHVFTNKFTSKRLCIVNTHLYYKRFSQYVRLLQMALLLNYLATKINDGKTAIILNGDLNSLRNDDLLEFLAGTEVTPDNSVWDNVRSIDQAFNVGTLNSPFTLNNASGCPPFTSFVPHCMETLDYIFCDHNFEVSGFVPLPEADEILPYVGIPSMCSPSDHLALVLDLKLTSS